MDAVVGTREAPILTINLSAAKVQMCADFRRAEALLRCIAFTPRCLGFWILPKMWMGVTGWVKLKNRTDLRRYSEFSPSRPR